MSVRTAKSRVTSIVLADDHAVVRQGLRRLLEAEPGLTVVEKAADGIAAVDLVEKLRPSVLVVDIMMPGLEDSTSLSRSRDAARARRRSSSSPCIPRKRT